MPSTEEAQALHDRGKFPYFHPCGGCGKACSTPTRELWVKRVNKFGNVSNVYSKFRCRDCKNSNHDAPVSPMGEGQPVQPTMTWEQTRDTFFASLQANRAKRPPGALGVTVFEDGKVAYTEWIRQTTTR